MSWMARSTLDSAPLSAAGQAKARDTAPLRASATASIRPRKRLRPSTGIAISMRASQPIARRKSEFAHQRPVDARRGDFQPIGLAHRLLEVEHRRQRLAGAFAIVDRHGSVRALGHDLHASRPGRRKPSREPRAIRDRANIGSAMRAMRRARPLSAIRRASSSPSSGAGAICGRDVASMIPCGNKKERVPAGPHSQNLSLSVSMRSYENYRSGFYPIIARNARKKRAASSGRGP